MNPNEAREREDAAEVVTNSTRHGSMKISKDGKKVTHESRG
jgi:hypothetical protein